VSVAASKCPTVMIPLFEFSHGTEPKTASLEEKRECIENYSYWLPEIAITNFVVFHCSFMLTQVISQKGWRKGHNTASKVDTFLVTTSRVDKTQLTRHKTSTVAPKTQIPWLKSTKHGNLLSTTMQASSSCNRGMKFQFVTLNFPHR